MFLIQEQRRVKGAKTKNQRAVQLEFISVLSDPAVHGGSLWLQLRGVAVGTTEHVRLIEDSPDSVMEREAPSDALAAGSKSAVSTASAQRQWSYLLYLNREWQESDGGCLRIHTDGGGEQAPPGAEPSYFDVPPRAGTLVLFRSTMPHEVLDTDASRLAIAGWLNRPVEGSSTRRGLIAKLGGALAVGSVFKFGMARLRAEEAARKAAEERAAAEAAAAAAAAAKAEAEAAARAEAAAEAARRLQEVSG